ncbi:unnamed protein product (macronuclear) [Paramecium tetraurelia]|uniref:Alpha-type protein kinase domain-containing protein n=1 Tax=Paramecium tetraurelia TaxID=5888 RepID=A0DE92_PARTE|nr:uncharacterized protein GSPATT00016201001 [Paramecium tetraurelia]CAK81359.1 unnamed protein product [Paramecium tetraurelia]|eukprot:XP_001448756.1 hypothetical protein (macronuclear) [Paramecium tetraurelia strain d4-2]
MNQSSDLAIKCPNPEHNKNVILVCFDECCPGQRLYCHQCVKIGVPVSHLEYQEELPFMFEHFKKVEKECDYLIDRMNKQMDMINQNYYLLVEGIRSKYQMSQQSLLNLSSEQINSFLSSSISFQLFQSKIQNLLEQLTNKFLCQLQQLLVDLNLTDLNYYQIPKINPNKSEDLHQTRNYQRINDKKKQDDRMIKEIIIKQQGFLEEYGKLDICYVIDFTSIMEKYIEQVRCCIQESFDVIKLQTNRDPILSSIAYYDIEQKPQNGKYHQFEFSNDIENLKQFIAEVPIKGGRDVPEDIRGALEQMITNLKWKNKFKIAILITDAPCHGRKYHNFPWDYHPNDDITETLHRLIEKQIILIGFNLNDRTVKIQKCLRLFFYVDASGFEFNKLAQKIAESLVSVSVKATQVNSKGTKSKKQQKESPTNTDGAIEALYKQGDFYNFEKQTRVVNNQFTVLNVTINDQVFADNLLSINKIGKNPETDYLIKVEGQFDCIRTEFPFAFGRINDVYLMKNKNGQQDEIYVIKSPLGKKMQISLDKADIDEALKQQNLNNCKFPDAVYSDCLILMDSQNKYWIAERFLKGEFVKYNNNYGYINECITELNKFDQAFSYYTFFISNGLYMINDVQGVGHYFTDPAVNTSTGEFDDTDQGQEGQGMFLVNFQSKIEIATKILKLLNMLIES